MSGNAIYVQCWSKYKTIHNNVGKKTNEKPQSENISWPTCCEGVNL